MKIPTTSYLAAFSLLVASSMLTGCKSKNPYPDETRSTFIQSCTNPAANATEAYCTCLFGKFQEKFTFEEFTVLDAQMSMGMQMSNDYNVWLKASASQCLQGR